MKINIYKKVFDWSITLSSVLEVNIAEISGTEVCDMCCEVRGGVKL